MRIRRMRAADLQADAARRPFGRRQPEALRGRAPACACRRAGEAPGDRATRSPLDP